MERGVWKAEVYSIANSQIKMKRLKKKKMNHLAYILEKEMATHASILAWRIPGTEEPGGLPSTGSHRVGHD